MHSAHTQNLSMHFFGRSFGIYAVVWRTIRARHTHTKRTYCAGLALVHNSTKHRLYKESIWGTSGMAFNFIYIFLSIDWTTRTHNNPHKDKGKILVRSDAMYKVCNRSAYMWFYIAVYIHTKYSPLSLSLSINIFWNKIIQHQKAIPLTA